MTPLDEILAHDPADPRLSRLQEWQAERERIAHCLAKLDSGMRVFDAVGGQSLDDHETTGATKVRWKEKLAALDKRIAREQGGGQSDRGGAQSSAKPQQ